MIIVGAGMAGLMAAQMLRRHRPHIREAQPDLPHNHSALLRFRTDAASRATGIPFRRVWVHKGVVDHNGPRGNVTLRDANQYSYKVTGELHSRSILSIEGGERYIAPANFISLLAEGLNFQFDAPLTDRFLAQLDQDSDPVISTIPMPTLMRIGGWNPEITPDFRWQEIWTVRGFIEEPKADLYQTLYFPDPAVPWYRISITGDEVIAESTMKAGDLEFLSLLTTKYFGLPDKAEIRWTDPRCQQYGKLNPVDDQKRRAFILAMTDRYRIYSLGRFATWRQILLDDIVQDVHIIEKFITERDAYGRTLAGMGK